MEIEVLALAVFGVIGWILLLSVSLSSDGLSKKLTRAKSDLAEAWELVDRWRVRYEKSAQAHDKAAKSLKCWIDYSEDLWKDYSELQNSLENEQSHYQQLLEDYMVLDKDYADLQTEHEKKMVAYDELFKIERSWDADNTKLSQELKGLKEARCEELWDLRGRIGGALDHCKKATGQACDSQLTFFNNYIKSIIDELHDSAGNLK